MTPILDPTGPENSTSEALYPLVEVGAKAIIYGAPPWGNQYFDSVTGT